MDEITIKHELNGCDLLDLIFLRMKDYSIELGETVEEVLNEARGNKYDGEDYFWLARINGKPTGYTYCEIDYNDMFSKRVYVLPEYRNRGIGTKLKEAQIELAKKLGLVRVVTEIEQENSPSIRVSEKCGFNFQKKGSRFTAWRIVMD